MSTEFKKWTHLGLTAVLAGSTLLAACGGEGEGEGEGEHGSAAIHGEGEGEGEGSYTVGGEGEGGEGEGGEGENGHAIDTLPLENRVAFMSGHVEAGLALFRAGAPEQAAIHLLHPVSETHEAERAGIDALGFKQELFETVSKALEDGLPAAEIEPQLAAAEANVKLMQENAGGDPLTIIEFLMDTVYEEYTIGVTDGVISDPGEYQDAFGFTVVAIDVANTVDAADTSALKSELETLLALWPDAPLADSTPAPVGQVVAQTSKVKLAAQALKN